METTETEIRREKVFIPQDMTNKEIMKKYGISEACASNAKKRGWFMKNYMTNQVIIDRENFNPAVSYSIAKQVFYKNYKRNPVAQNIKEEREH